MKKLILFFAVASTVLFTNCSKDSDDTDRIVGTWINETSITPDGGSTTTYEDTWVFNDDLSGTYTETTNGELDYETTFTWVKDEDFYNVAYDDEDTDTFTIGEALGFVTLESGDTIVATKQ